MNIKGQGHLLNLLQGHSDSTFSNFVSLETARPIEAKSHVAHPWDGERKFVQMLRMAKMAAMPIYGKNIKKSSSLEPKR